MGLQWPLPRRAFSRFTLYTLSFFFLACVYWLRDSFGYPTIQQILFHLWFSEGLISDSDPVFLVTFIVECLIAPVTLACIIVLTEQALADYASKRSPPLQQQVAGWCQSMVAGLPVCVLTASLAIFAAQFSVFSYVTSRFGTDRFAQLYVEPASVRLNQGPLKNLILIYVESLETSYSDPDIFGKDLLQELNALSGVSFESYGTAPGTNWTIAALVATQCGVPLQFVTRMDDFETGESIRSFLPGAVCLPDILRNFGYRNVFLGAADLSFAGKGAFLSSHGYVEAYGSDEWEQSHADLRRNVWGIYDHDLFALAREKLAALHATGERFNLTVLTIDTHHPKGYYSPPCRAGGAAKFEDIVECISGELAAFVDFVEDSGYLQDTNIVILGDHLAVVNPVYEKLVNSPHRRIFNKFISSASVAKNTEEIIPFDLFPTILEYAGVQIDGDRLALGRSALFETASAPSLERPEAAPGILNFSRKYEQLWVADAAPAALTSSHQPFLATAPPAVFRTAAAGDRDALP